VDFVNAILDRGSTPLTSTKYLLQKPPTRGVEQPGAPTDEGGKAEGVSDVSKRCRGKVAGVKWLLNYQRYLAFIFLIIFPIMVECREHKDFLLRMGFTML